MSRFPWLAFFLSSLLVSSFATRAAETTLKVCADPNNPPFSQKDGKGFENKIAEMIAEDQGRKVEYTWFPQRMGFIRNTLKAKQPDSENFLCDVVIGVPTGYEMAATTNSYYRSTYALVYRKGRGWDDIHGASDLDGLSDERRAKLRMAMQASSPGTTWMFKHHLADQGIPYPDMSGDARVNTAQMLEKELLDGKVDMAILWGPFAAYLVTHNKPGMFEMIPLQSEEGVKLDFPISMGVRFPDQERKEALNGWIERHQKDIRALLAKYRVPLVDEPGKLLSAD